ncbi:putative membrane protein [Caulobacter ginsengisoli]|uniref:Membrane protein n=1 Tax=Caulobacter ginsengisoli TaxID=400775 RepID=A0ABU0ILN0_9CAUL|nr:hypothetical protein [Caulobacter ginsengisoli]MDQ0462923.1 putative membrane protein [Caulobacter ginsengisoli]
MTIQYDEDLVAGWLRRFKWALKRMPSPEREDIVAETRAHLHERMAGGLTAVQALANFGAPEAYAGKFLDEMYLSAAAGSQSWSDNLRAVARFATRSGVAFVAIFVVLMVGSLGLGFLIAGVWKIFDPAHVGMWVGPRDFALGVVDHPEASRELLGNWMYPLCAAAVALAWFICRGVLLWAVRILAPKA